MLEIEIDWGELAVNAQRTRWYDVKTTARSYATREKLGLDFDSRQNIQKGQKSGMNINNFRHISIFTIIALHCEQLFASQKCVH